MSKRDGERKSSRSKAELQPEVLVNFDDSSDEEESVHSYDIRSNVASVGGSVEGSGVMLSYIAQGLGVYVLYSPAVQKRYYELKKQKLCGASVDYFQSDASMASLIDDNVAKIKYWAGGDLRKTGGKYSRGEIQNLTALKDEIMSQFVNAKVEYCKLYGLGKEAFLDRIGELSVNLRSINNFTNNFALPNPLSAPRTILDGETTEFDLSGVPEESFVVEFLSNLRLHNRSEKRHIKNKNDRYDEETANHIWQVTPENSVVVQHNFTNKFGRDELVRFGSQSMATYPQLFGGQTDEEWQSLLSNRINIKRGAADLSSNILSLWYMIFGCDVIKHPASLIHINMVFDLAEAGLLSREGLSDPDICKQTIPMSNKALSNAMFLNEFYTDHMPHRYKYNPAQGYDTKSALIASEEDLTRRWMEFKLGKGVSDYLIIQCVSDANAVDAIWKLILESFDKWQLNSCFHIAEEGQVAELSVALAALNTEDHH